MKPNVLVELSEYERLKAIERELLSGEKKVVVSISRGFFDNDETSVYFLSDDEFKEKLSRIELENKILKKENEFAVEILQKLSKCNVFEFRKWRSYIKKRSLNYLMFTYFITPIRWFSTNEIDAK